MRQRYKLANESETKQEEREREDIAFEDGEQWPETLRIARQGQQPVNGLPAVPARPTLVIDKVKEPVRQILNQERATDLGIQITPADDFGDLGITPDDTEVLLREGLVRRIQRESHAQDARSWAFKRAVIAGRGYYIVRTRYLPGQTWDQEIYIDRIYNQASVKLDPTHQMPDGSDADWEFMGTWMPWDRFLAEYPQDADGKTNPFSDMAESEFVGMTEDYPDWYRLEDKERSVRIVDYWYTERTVRTLVLLQDGSAVWEDEAPEGAQILDSRPVLDKKILFAKVAGGSLVLERTEETGPNMPIVKVIGDEVLPYDSQRRYNGVIRPARDSQMGLNYMISKQVEVVGLSPIPALMVDPDAIDGFEEWYKQSNTRTLPYLPYRTRDDNGQELRRPERPSADPNIYPIAQSIALFDASIKSTTAVPDSSLGNVDPSLKSGKAIREVVQNAQLSTSNFLDNLSRSMAYEGRIINDKLEPIYGARPGRLVRILTGEGEEQTLSVGQGQQKQQAQQAQGQQRAKAAKVAKLTKDARFNVIIKLARSSENRRQQFLEMFGQILGADPSQMMIAGDLFYKNMDIPEARQLSKRMRVMLAPPVQQFLQQEEDGQPHDPAAQAQIAQLTQQLQQLQQIAQQQQQEIQTRAADNQTKVQIEQMRMQLEAQKTQIEVQRDIQLQQMQDATQLRVKEIDAQMKGLQLGHTLLHEADALGREQQHELTLQQQSQQHEDTSAQRAFEQSQVMAAQEAAQQPQENPNAGSR